MLFFLTRTLSSVQTSCETQRKQINKNVFFFLFFTLANLHESNFVWNKSNANTQKFCSFCFLRDKNFYTISISLLKKVKNIFKVSVTNFFIHLQLDLHSNDSTNKKSKFFFCFVHYMHFEKEQIKVFHFLFFASFLFSLNFSWSCYLIAKWFFLKTKISFVKSISFCIYHHTEHQSRIFVRKNINSQKISKS